VPCAAAGSIPFLPKETISMLKSLKERYPRCWDRYGFIDAFNPVTNWYNPDVIGIDLGVTILMAENYRTGFVWEYFMRNEEIVRAMQMVGFSVHQSWANSGAINVLPSILIIFVLIFALNFNSL
jgi:hypothetical protein